MFSVDHNEKPQLPLLNFRTVAVQILLVAAASFCTIGSFDALQGLGGAGQEQPYVANAATAINFGLLGVVCAFLGGPTVNWLGVRWSLAIGTCGDPLFAAAVYCSTRYGTQWFLIFASVLRGACSGLFWAAEGAVIIGYPRARHRGKSITVWVAFKEMGSVVSSAINLGISAKDDHSGHVSYAVYYATIAIMCAGLPLALLLSPTSKVVHLDRTPVSVDNSRRSYRQECVSLARQLRRTEVLLIIPFCWFAYFYYSFSHTFVTQHFTVRARALTSLLTSIASITGSAIIALASDRRGARSNRRLITLTVVVLAVCTAAWIYFSYVVLHDPSKKKFDWTSPRYAYLAMSVVMLYLAQQSAQTYLYWTAAHLTDNLRDAFHLAGLVRGIESLGQCLAYGVNSTDTPPITSIALNLAFLAIGGVFLVVLVVYQNKESQKAAGLALERQEPFAIEVKSEARS